MSEFLRILIYVAIGLAVAFIAYVSISAARRFYKKDEPKCEPECVPESTPEVAIEPVVEEKAKEVVPVEELVIGEVNQPSPAKKEVKRIPFSIKLLSLGLETEEYFDTIYNALVSYRKVNARISQKFVSFRNGRDLIARFAIRGKTMKLYLALNVKDFDEKIYFQKDSSDVKTYEEVPFTVKVKSGRACKKALILVDALAEKLGLQKKSRIIKVDSIQLVKQALI